MKTISESFTEQAVANPERVAIMYPDGALTFGQLNRLFISFARRMSAEGVTSASKIMLDTSDLQVVLATLLGAAHLGAGFVQWNDGIPTPDDLTITHRFHSTPTTTASTDNSILIDLGWSPAQNPGDLPTHDRTDTDRLWLYLYTSGTTGIPKFVGLSQRMVIDRSIAVSDEFVGGKTRFASTMPILSRTYLIRALAALVNGATIVAGTDIDFWIRAGATMVSGSPAQMRPFLGERVLNLRLPLVEVMGSRLSLTDARDLLRSFETVQDVFGAAEANKLFTNVSTLDENGTMQTKGQLRDSEIEIVDINGAKVPTGEDGLLRVRNSYMVNGYLNDPDTEQSAFRDGWFYSGDVAAWGANGVLQIRNRADHVVNIGGAKINAFAVDSIFRSVDGIRDAVCFKNPKGNSVDELFAFVVFDDGCNRFQAIESARFHCRDKLGESMVPRIVKGVAGIPRRPDGSPDRQACAALILSINAEMQQSSQSLHQGG